MWFLESLKAYLDGVSSGRAAFTPDIPAHRRELLDALEELEREGESPGSIERLHTVWSSQLASFVGHLGADLRDSLGHGQSREEVAALINTAIRRQLGLSATLGSKAKDLELDRLVTSATFVGGLLAGSSEASMNPARYAREIRAVRRITDIDRLTPIGRLALDLPIRDVVRWLLSVEAVQSHGRDDRWRLSRASAAALLKEPAGRVSFLNDEEKQPLPANWRTLKRLEGMDILSIEDDYEVLGSKEFHVASRYELRAEGRPLIEEIASGQATPFAVLAEALLQDETSAVVGQVRPAAAAIQSEGAAAATARHARMVAHEIRNALVPVQGTLEALYRDMERQGDGPLIEKHRDLIDGGIDRIFRFVREMVNVAERGAEPAELFDILPAVEDAIAAIRSETGRAVDFSAKGKLPQVLGIRSRFAMAMVNLLRNAAQARQGQTVEIRVLASAAEGGSGVIVTVDDSGPGVPPEHRAAIFERGFSLREGGTGQGLALVREVVEAEMHGRVVCEESQLGGARFVLTIPVAERTSG